MVFILLFSAALDVTVKLNYTIDSEERSINAVRHPVVSAHDSFS
jgi:hypothetical protein